MSFLLKRLLPACLDDGQHIAESNLAILVAIAIACQRDVFNTQNRHPEL
jgi:hypothetical protein